MTDVLPQTKHLIEGAIKQKVRVEPTDLHNLIRHVCTKWEAATLTPLAAEIPPDQTLLHDLVRKPRGDFSSAILPNPIESQLSLCRAPRVSQSWQDPRGRGSDPLPRRLHNVLPGSACSGTGLLVQSRNIEVVQRKSSSACEGRRCADDGV